MDLHWGRGEAYPSQISTAATSITCAGYNADTPACVFQLKSRLRCKDLRNFNCFPMAGFPIDIRRSHGISLLYTQMMLSFCTYPKQASTKNASFGEPSHPFHKKTWICSQMSTDLSEKESYWAVHLLAVHLPFSFGGAHSCSLNFANIWVGRLIFWPLLAHCLQFLYLHSSEAHKWICGFAFNEKDSTVLSWYYVTWSKSLVSGI